MRQLMTEAFVLCLLGTLTGLLLAAVALPVFVAQSPSDVPRLAQAHISGPVILAAAVIALLATLIAGVAPALRQTRAGLSEGAGLAARGSTGGGRDRFRQILVAIEVGLALMLLMGAGLLVRSGQNLGRVSPGFDPRDLITARLALPLTAYPGEEKPAGAVARMVDDLAGRAGVVEAAASTRPPLIGDVNYGLRIEGRSTRTSDRINGRMQLVTPGYLETMRVPVRLGRTFNPADRRDAVRVMIISETLAREAWPGESPVGKRIGCCEGSDDHPVWKEVVGVVADTKARGISGPGLAEFYLPMEQAPARAFEANGGSITLVARAAQGQAEQLTSAVREAVRSVDPGVPLYDVTTMESRVAASTAVARLNSLLFFCLSFVGLALAAVGIYGVIGYLVSQRVREFGVRLALGARPRDVVALVVSQGLGATALGLLFGGLGVLAQGRAIDALLFGVSGRDPLTFGVVTVGLGLCAVGASVVPALRASRIEPAKALAES